MAVENNVDNIVELNEFFFKAVTTVNNISEQLMLLELSSTDKNQPQLQPWKSYHNQQWLVILIKSPFHTRKLQILRYLGLLLQLVLKVGFN